jgi:tetratricopeptide (TPR) repeat protein
MAGVDKSVGLFEQAIAKDPSFAPAYARLSMARAMRSGDSPVNVEEELAGMRAAAEKAIQLDPLLAEAHNALAMVYAREAQWERSEASFRRAIELDTHVWSARIDFVMYNLVPLGRMEEALRESRISERIDPSEPTVRFVSALLLTGARRYDDAARYCENLPDDYPMKINCLGRVRLGQGRVEEAIRILAASRFPFDQASLGNAYARAGRRDEAEKLATLTGDPFFQALIFAGLGDKDRTLNAVDRIVPLGPFRMGRALLFPELDLLRGDPRLKVLRRKAGLPD